MLTSIEALEALYGQPLARSTLWDPARYVERSRLPSAGDMHKRIFDETFDALAYDRDLVERMRTSLY